MLLLRQSPCGPPSPRGTGLGVSSICAFIRFWFGNSVLEGGGILFSNPFMLLSDFVKGDFSWHYWFLLHCHQSPCGPPSPRGKDLAVSSIYVFIGFVWRIFLRRAEYKKRPPVLVVFLMNRQLSLRKKCAVVT